MNAERQRMLVAMGIDLYALRTPAAAGAVSTAPPARAASADTRLVVVCPSAMRSDKRLARLLAHLPQTLAIGADAIRWYEADARGQLDGVDAAPAYLAFGTAMARALGAQLTTAQQSAATIAVTAEPAQLPGRAADKRALWQALKPIARRLREAGGD